MTLLLLLATSLFAVLALVIGFEAFGVGLGTAAFVSYIATTTDPRSPMAAAPARTRAIGPSTSTAKSSSTTASSASSARPNPATPTHTTRASSPSSCATAATSVM